jgi:hypothetical protein
VKDSIVSDLTSQHAEERRAVAESALRNSLSKVKKKIMENLNAYATLEGMKPLNPEVDVDRLAAVTGSVDIQELANEISNIASSRQTDD